MSAPTFPTLVTREGKGAPLTDKELDDNFTNTRSYCLQLANMIVGSINPDGTLTPNSVGSSAIQAAAVALASLNPALLYSIVPIDTDTGSVNSYRITARGGAPGTNIIPPGSVYDANGNFVLSGLTRNFGYMWTKGTGDVSLVVDSQTTLDATGAFTATQTAVTLIGQASAPVSATVVQSAPISAYKDGQLFFVYTPNANTAPATLEVNGLGAVPILMGGTPITAGVIGANSVFAVVYRASIGGFILFSGSGGSGSGSSNSIIGYTFNGTILFASGDLPLPGSGSAYTLSTGFGALPTTVLVALRKIASDATDGLINIGESVSVGNFQSATGPGFTVSFDPVSISVRQAIGALTIEGAVITSASWVMVVSATKETNVTSTAFPALEYQVTGPVGAFAYGNNLIIHHFGPSSGKTFAAAIDLTLNKVKQLLSPAGNPQFHNVATFLDQAGLAGLGSGQIVAVFTSNTGVYAISATDPTASVVPLGATYDGSGNYVLTVTVGLQYSWGAGTNDIGYDNGSGTVTTSPFTAAAGTVTLKGNSNAPVTASVKATAATWQASKILNQVSEQSLKPVWMNRDGSGNLHVFGVWSNYGVASGLPGVKNLVMHDISAAGVAVVGTSPNNLLDLTNSGIGNIAEFNVWHSTGNSDVLLFQYNPTKKRFYVLTRECSFMHIFNIANNAWNGGVESNDISAFWAAGTARYSSLAYVKSFALAGIGAAWGTINQDHITVEIDAATGTEKSIVIVRNGDNPAGIAFAGSVTRIPWVE